MQLFEILPFKYRRWRLKFTTYEIIQFSKYIYAQVDNGEG